MSYPKPAGAPRGLCLSLRSVPGTVGRPACVPGHGTSATPKFDPQCVVPDRPHPALMTLAVALGGACGAVSRFTVAEAVARWRPGFPWLATLAVNLAGCLLIGAAMTLFAERPAVPPLLRVLAVTGFLGSLTTFSTFGYESLWLARDQRRVDLALLAVALNVCGGLLAVWLGRRAVLAVIG